jgi:glucosamine--fructose-6-phosphate aminotransferase (isomerizing)
MQPRACSSLQPSLRKKSKALFTTEPGESAATIARARSRSAQADAICLIQSFYAMAVQLAQRLDMDADRPRT